MIENQFVAFKLDHGFRIDVGGRTVHFDLGSGFFWVSIRSSGNSAMDAGADLDSRRTPAPLLRKMAADPWRRSDTGRIDAKGRQTRLSPFQQKDAPS